MARKPSVKVVLNRSMLAELHLAFADGLAEVGRTILDTATPPDATPYGSGLVTRGGYLVYAGSDKVAGYGQDGRQPKKPRALRVRGSSEIAMVVGYGFPGRFQEMGTVHHPPQTFFTPAVDAVLPAAKEIIGDAVRPRLGKR